MDVPWKDRIACLMPMKRLSRALLLAVDRTYVTGKGGYNEVAVPTINRMYHHGTFGVATMPCMEYAYRTQRAAIRYNAFRASGVDVMEGPDACLLHPVKAKRTNATALPPLQQQPAHRRLHQRAPIRIG